MPHIIVEYTETLNLDFAKMIDDLHTDLAGRETIDIHAVKSRAIPVKYNMVGGPQDHNAFIHVTLKLLEGRDPDLRREMAEGLHGIAKHPAHDDRIAVSVEVAEMKKSTYVK